MKQIQIDLVPSVHKLYSMWLAGAGKTAQEHLTDAVMSALREGITLSNGTIFMIRDDQFKSVESPQDATPYEK